MFPLFKLQAPTDDGTWSVGAPNDQSQLGRWVLRFVLAKRTYKYSAMSAISSVVLSSDPSNPFWINPSSLLNGGVMLKLGSMGYPGARWFVVP